MRVEYDTSKRLNTNRTHMIRGQRSGAMPRRTLRLPGHSCVMGGMRSETATCASVSCRPSLRLPISSVALARSHSKSQRE